MRAEVVAGKPVGTNQLVAAAPGLGRTTVLKILKDAGVTVDVSFAERSGFEQAREIRNVPVRVVPTKEIDVADLVDIPIIL